MTVGVRETWAHTWAEPPASCVTWGSHSSPLHLSFCVCTTGCGCGFLQGAPDEVIKAKRMAPFLEQVVIIGVT